MRSALLAFAFLCGCGGPAGEMLSASDSGLFDDLSLPKDAQIISEVTYPSVAMEAEGILTFATEDTFSAIQELCNESLVAAGWKYGLRRDREEPHWNEWNHAGFFRRDDGRERITVFVKEQKPEQHSGGWTIVVPGESPEPEKEFAKTVYVMYRRALPAQDRVDALIRAAEARRDDLIFQYDLGMKLVKEDPKAALVVAKRLLRADAGEFTHHLLAARAYEELREERSESHYREALKLLRFTGLVDVEKAIRKKLGR